MTVAQLLKHDFSKGSLHLYDANDNLIYSETLKKYWCKHDYDDNDNLIYFETSIGYWSKREFDSNGNLIYYEDSTGYIEDNRPKKDSCDGKVVEIDGKKYKLSEI